MDTTRQRRNPSSEAVRPTILRRPQAWAQTVPAAVPASGRTVFTEDGGDQGDEPCPSTELPRERDLRSLTRDQMPHLARGALVVGFTDEPAGCRVVWQPADGAARIPSGRILLSWAPTGDGRMDVTARLGLSGRDVLLATWPGLEGEWSCVVRPTLVEVMDMHAVLRLAADALEMAAASEPGRRSIGA